ncbi:DUF1684 domain-containing protein [Seonamhaeicola marinus]|uniref:DUF1684 domain-containing protein n=1 Tax=Seonamhaeicola marinus TaxID=1912246 RepID=A0A5D0JR57_9FLAO|nr:DUF1684 domain-containing protein [Seonamhaeicola marinus]TYA97871.1 DUF1684 domain-containing protein [Seonamhaeicola marinus]
MKNVTLILLFVSLISCGQDKTPIKGETEYQRAQNAKFKDVTESPLTDKDRKKFTGLDFFKVDSSYVVSARFKRTPNEISFKMKTTTNRRPEYVKYGELSFTLKGKDLKLDIYQNQELIQKEGYEDYLFLPFLDETNGVETYGGGRYIDARIPEGDTMVINFNEAYNPYCAYSERYSCPVVPRQNYLRVRIEAGVKAFEKH